MKLQYSIYYDDQKINIAWLSDKEISIFNTKTLNFETKKFPDKQSAKYWLINDFNKHIKNK